MQSVGKKKKKDSQGPENIIWESLHHVWAHCFFLGFSTVFAFPGAAPLIMASLLSTMTLSCVSATLVHLTFLHFEIYFPLHLYFPHLIFNAFCSVCLYTPRGRFKLLSYSLSFQLFPFPLLLFNVFWRVNEHSWYSIILISEFLLLNDSQHRPNTSSKISDMQLSFWLSLTD